MKKSISIVLSLVLLIAMVPSFAAFTEADKAAEKLVAYGVIKGDQNNNLMMGKNLKRENAAIILCRMMGVEDEAKLSDASILKFVDMKDKLSDETARFVAYTYKKKWFRGMSATDFGWGKEITAQQFATILLRALGYEPKYEQAFELAREKGLFARTTNVKKLSPIVRSNVYLSMVNTLDKNKKGGNKPLKEILGFTDAASKEFIVKNIEPAGINVIWITFNKEVDLDTLQEIEVKDGSSSAIKISASKKVITLSEDKKTAAVLLKDSAAKQNKKLEVKVKDVKSSKKALKVKKITEKVTLFDNKKPEIVKVDVINQKLIRLVTTEPLDFGRNMRVYHKEILIDGKKAYARIEKSYQNYIDIQFNKSLRGGEHTIKVSSDIHDYLGLPLVPFEGKFTTTVDSSAPTVEKMLVVDRNTIKAVFNEKLNPSKKGEFRINGDLTTITIDGNTMTLSLAAPLTINALIEIKGSYKGQSDLVGNTIKSKQEIVFKAENDTNLPEVELSKVEADAITLKFDKAMDVNASYDWIIKNSKGDVIGRKGANTDDWTVGEDHKILVVKPENFQGRDTEKMTIELKDFRDGSIRQNEMKDVVLDFDCKDSKKPVVVNLDGVDDDEQQYMRNPLGEKDANIIVINFSEKMKTEALLNEDNYRIYSNGGQLVGLLSNVKGASIELVNDKQVKIILNKAIPGIQYTDKFKIQHAEDLAGNKLNTQFYIERGVPAEATVESTTLKKDEDGDYYLEFAMNKKVVIVEAGDVEYNGNTMMSINGEEFTDKVKYAIPDGVTVDESAANKGFTEQIQIKQKAFETEYGAVLSNQFAIAGASIIDKVKPSVKKIEFTNATTIEITYTENVSAGGSAIVLKDDKVVDASAVYANNIVTITVPQVKKDVEYKVQLDVVDGAGNHSGLLTKKLSYKD